MTFDEDLASKLYYAGKTDAQIGKAVGKSYRTINLWRRRRNLPCITKQHGVSFCEVLTPEQSKKMEKFLSLLSRGAFIEAWPDANV